MSCFSNRSQCHVSASDLGVMFQQLISQQAQARALENKSPAVDHRKSSTSTDKPNEEEEKENEVRCHRILCCEQIWSGGELIIKWGPEFESTCAHFSLKVCSLCAVSSEFAK